MDLLADPVLFNPGWFCPLVGGVLLAVAVHDSKFRETTGLRRAAIAFFALGIAFFAADVYVSLQLMPGVR